MNANRISWFFNFKGTSFNVDSACSSSLVALDLACNSLIAGDTNMVRQSVNSSSTAVTFFVHFRLISTEHCRRLQSDAFPGSDACFVEPEPFISR